ncbi:PREDICTED: atlastin isoform X2 [Wasmannia auropunctata]|uniref:atlastin isoform X2 n=1 Tax=Wasmannia auropunctata TaxID=64793 RepID=UPI0005EDBD11|nr:PREDICTED: atlastin isoform X2 [Wasmannia auropunctata]
MAERKLITPRRKRLNDPSGSRPPSDVPKEPARPPRTRTQQTAYVTTTHNSDFGNGTQRSVFVKSQQKPTEKAPMTTLDENVNRVPRQQHKTAENMDHLGKFDRIERLSPMEDVQMQDGDADGGRPVQVVLAHPDHTFELDEDALSEILLQDDVKDRSVVVVSVAGAFRKGKSFLLDFFLRYMNSKYTLHNNTESWLGAEDEPLSGFSWRGGSERDTTGILMWSKVYPATLANGEEIAVILMDTQGAFDSQSTVRDCATVFALSTMLSSVQIYNLSQNIQEDDLQHLQLFTEYGRLALESSDSTPFQRLQFLVRDWVYPYEADYGANGGKKLLDKRLEISDRQHPELQSLRKHIKSCFSDISCFLMPHPGLEIATNPIFDGRLSEIQAEFKKQLKVLIPMILAPENLVTKKINGQVVKAKDLLEYFKSYINLYRGDELPEPKSMLVATAEANNLTAVAEAKDLYLQMMETVCGGTKPFLATAHLESEHQHCMDMALRQFQNKRKMGGEEFSQIYMEKLIKDMDDAFTQFKAHNESKNIFKAARTPAVFFAIAVTMYILSGIFGLVGLYTLANVCNLIMGVGLLTLVLWAYIRYSGEFREIGTQIDDMASKIWENFMKPLYQQFVEKSVSVAVAQAAEIAVTNSTMNATANGKPKLL